MQTSQNTVVYLNTYNKNSANDSSFDKTQKRSIRNPKKLSKSRTLIVALCGLVALGVYTQNGANCKQVSADSRLCTVTSWDGTTINRVERF